ncbi:hypothetical protein CK203_033376 [Vitis vinifera]|uniref:Uncharacterized protein n=1 Tax=Vitis vinifera TaxID=29760 RepID=A0A438HML1_VITVI|nr:hypothetical protein CK203_033376 [Vitis vinifera]
MWKMIFFNQVGLIGYGAEQGATLTDLGWVLVSLAIVGQGPSNATMPMLPRWRHWRSSLSVPAARLLRCEPHRWLQHVDDSGREWLVRNVRVDELHSGSELGLFGGAEGWRRQRVQSACRHLGARSTVAAARTVHPPPKTTC